MLFCILQTRTHKPTNVCTHALKRAHTYTDLLKCTRTDGHTYSNARAHSRTPALTHTHANTRKHTQTHTCTRTYSNTYKSSAAPCFQLLSQSAYSKPPWARMQQSSPASSGKGHLRNKVRVSPLYTDMLL